ncbi:hypothetical protein QO058_10155 [Bosea vestrisii]|nr:hypothetical protein [Bosea vestrisii]WID98561.1 hypothetical protein QO058_10155 [Bosea vestrisii]
MYRRPKAAEYEAAVVALSSSLAVDDADATSRGDERADREAEARIDDGPRMLPGCLESLGQLAAEFVFRTEGDDRLPIEVASLDVRLACERVPFGQSNNAFEIEELTAREVVFLASELGDAEVDLATPNKARGVDGIARMQRDRDIRMRRGEARDHCRKPGDAERGYRTDDDAPLLAIP